MVVHNVDIRTIWLSSEHSRAEASLCLGTPPMQEYKSRAIGIEQQMIEVVLGVFWIAGNSTELCNISDGNYQVLLAGFEVESEDARIFRRQFICIRVGQAYVTIARAHFIDSSEIRGDGCTAISANSIEWIRQRSLLARENIKNVANEPASLSVVPHDLVL